MFRHSANTRHYRGRCHQVHEILGATLLALAKSSGKTYLPMREELARTFKRLAHAVQFAGSAIFDPMPLCKHFVAHSLDTEGLGPRSLTAGQFGLLTYDSELAGALADLHARVLVGDKNKAEIAALLAEMHEILDNMFTVYNDERLLREERASADGGAPPSAMQTRLRRQLATEGDGSGSEGADEDAAPPAELDVLPEVDLDEFKSIAGLWLPTIVFSKDLRSCNSYIFHDAMAQIEEIDTASGLLINWALSLQKAGHSALQSIRFMDDSGSVLYSGFQMLKMIDDKLLCLPNPLVAINIREEYEGHKLGASATIYAETLSALRSKCFVVCKDVDIPTDRDYLRRVATFMLRDPRYRDFFNKLHDYHEFLDKVPSIATKLVELFEQERCIHSRASSSSASSASSSASASLVIAGAAKLSGRGRASNSGRGGGGGGAGRRVTRCLNCGGNHIVKFCDAKCILPGYTDMKAKDCKYAFGFMSFCHMMLKHNLKLPNGIEVKDVQRIRDYDPDAALATRNAALAARKGVKASPAVALQWTNSDPNPSSSSVAYTVMMDAPQPSMGISEENAPVDPVSISDLDLPDSPELGSLCAGLHSQDEQTHLSSNEFDWDGALAAAGVYTVGDDLSLLPPSPFSSPSAKGMREAMLAKSADMMGQDASMRIGVALCDSPDATAASAPVLPASPVSLSLPPPQRPPSPAAGSDDQQLGGARWRLDARWRKRPLSGKERTRRWRAKKARRLKNERPVSASSLTPPISLGALNLCAVPRLSAAFALHRPLLRRRPAPTGSPPRTALRPPSLSR